MSDEPERPPPVTRDHQACVPEREGSAYRSQRSGEALVTGLFASGLWGDDDELTPEAGVDIALLSAERARRTGRPRRAAGARRRESGRPYCGRRTGTVAAGGRRVDIDWTDSLLRAATRRHVGPDRAAVRLAMNDLRRRVRVHFPDQLLLIVVDASGSMGTRQTALAKDIALTLLERAYLARDSVAMVAFRGRSAELVFASTRQTERVHRALRDLPMGGTTPLAEGLRIAHQTLVGDRRHHARPQSVLLVSDGCANIGRGSGHESVLREVERAAHRLAREPDVPILFVDTTEAGKLDRASRHLAELLGAERLALAELAGDGQAAEIARRLRATSTASRWKKP